MNDITQEKHVLKLYQYFRLKRQNSILAILTSFHYYIQYNKITYLWI